jgi:hypothetical protein
MKRIILYTAAALFAVSLMSSAQAGGGRMGRGQRGDGTAREHWEKQHEENHDFRQTLKEMEPAEAIEAIRSHREMQHKENLAFFAEQKDKHVERVNGREKLTDDQKAELVSFIEVMYAKKVAFCTEMHEDFMDLLDELAGQEGLTKKELHQALKAHHEEHKGEVKDFMQEQREAWKEKITELFGESRGRRNRERNKR